MSSATDNAIEPPLDYIQRIKKKTLIEQKWHHNVFFLLKNGHFIFDFSIRHSEKQSFLILYTNIRTLTSERVTRIEKKNCVCEYSTPARAHELDHIHTKWLLLLLYVHLLFWMESTFEKQKNANVSK